jgi:hypothetical protein
MSPERKKSYERKLRTKAFYIVENELNNKENPPEHSAVIGTETDVFSRFDTSEQERIVKKEKKNNKHNQTPLEKRYSYIIDSIQCPSLPIQWRNNLNTPVPKAVFSPLCH